VARYDAARTDATNRKHWANADGLSADAGLTPAVRRTIRNRTRYETDNNGYCDGIVESYLDWVVGRGPKLQVRTEDKELNAAVEQAFARWSKAASLRRKLRLLLRAALVDGEGFMLLANNPAYGPDVMLDIVNIEADRVTSMPFVGPKPKVDGIEFDSYGNPTEYILLKTHPGSTYFSGGAAFEQETIPASHMIHYFYQRRPEQHRGVSRLVGVIERFAQLRRYTESLLRAVENASAISLMFKTTLPPSGEAASVEQGAEIDLEPNTALFLPEGWEPEQPRAPQPAADYKTFKRETISEGGRPLSMPANIAACDSSNYNYASGRLDHQTFYRRIQCERVDLEETVLDRILAAFVKELQYLPDYQRLGFYAEHDAGELPHVWYWDGFEHVDPAKEALAVERKLAVNATTLAEVYASQGKDWQDEIEQRARELKKMQELGVPPVIGNPKMKDGVR